jgi:N-acetylglucosaminyl-diphospho-decaprenol L-rhamnosyltransferase
VSVAVVTLTQGHHDLLRAQHVALVRGSRQPDTYVVVALGDPGLEGWPSYGGLRARILPVDTDPEGLPCAAARNWGLDLAAAAGSDVLVCLDVDCPVGPDLVATYEDAVRSDPDRVWMCSADDACPEAVSSWSFALSAATWRRSGGFSEAHLGSRGGDADYGRQLARLGIGLGSLDAGGTSARAWPSARGVHGLHGRS